MTESKAKYGVHETNPLSDADREFTLSAEEHVGWQDKRLKRITRLRLLSDPGFPLYDVSYCVGELHDGTAVHVNLPFSQLPRRGLVKAIIAYAKEDRVYAKGLGILDNISTLVGTLRWSVKRPPKLRVVSLPSRS